MFKKLNEKRLKLMAELCGQGLIADIGFASHPNLFLKGKVIGVDMKWENTPPNYWKTLIASGEALPFYNVLDAICAGEVIEHNEAPITFLVECNKALKMNGKLVLSTPNPYHPGEIIKNILGNTENLYADGHFYMFSYRFLLKLLELTGFHMMRCYGNYCKLPGLPLRIPTQVLPTISSNILYYSKKVRNVRSEDIAAEVLNRRRTFLENYKREKGKYPSWYSHKAE